MKKYVLLQAPKTNAVDYMSQIEIIDNSDIIGKKRVEKRIMEGYTPVGCLESDLHVQQLKAGFSWNLEARFDCTRDKIREAAALLDGIR